MERKEFIRKCCYGSLGIAVGAGVLSACEGIHYVQASASQNRLIIPMAEFVFEKKGILVPRKFVMIESSNYNFPICVYRIGEGEYISSLMECTHQGCGLNVGGGVYSCPCHGSEFSNTGKVLEGPAEQDLKTFITKVEQSHVIIELA